MLPIRLSSLLVLLAALVLAESAQAISFRVTGFSGCVDPMASGVYSCVGGEITFGLRVLEDPGDEDIAGLGVSVTGYGSNEFVRGRAVSSYLHTFADPEIGAFGGFENIAGGALRENAIGANGNRVQFMLSHGPRPPSPFPLLPNSDPGLDGIIGGGGAMFEFTFRIVETATYRIGTSYQGDGIIGPGGMARQIPGISIHITGDHVPVVVLPEPSTALLLGLGLMTLGASRRRD